MPDVRQPRFTALSVVRTPAAAEVQSDDQLMELASAGDQRAYVQLVERYQRRVRGFCRVLLRDETLAFDLSQEVFLKIWTARTRYRPRGRFKEYLFTVARNSCRSYMRKRAVIELLGLPAEWGQRSQAAALTACDDRAYEETLQRVELALLRLPPQFREPLSLRYVEGFDYAEIARVIGRTESAARSRVFYGLKRLSALLGQEVQL